MTWTSQAQGGKFGRRSPLNRGQLCTPFHTVERQVQVKGPDAQAFADYVITRDATRIKPMTGRYVILCNERGGILNDPVLLRPAVDEFWFSLADSDMLLWLQGIVSRHVV